MSPPPRPRSNFLLASRLFQKMPIGESLSLSLFFLSLYFFLIFSISHLPPSCTHTHTHTSHTLHTHFTHTSHTLHTRSEIARCIDSRLPSLLERLSLSTTSNDTKESSPLSLSYIHAHAHALTYGHTHLHTHTLALTHSHTHTLAHTNTCTHTLAHILLHTHTLALTHTPALTLAHAHIYFIPSSPFPPPLQSSCL